VNKGIIMIDVKKIMDKIGEDLGLKTLLDNDWNNEVIAGLFNGKVHADLEVKNKTGLLTIYFPQKMMPKVETFIREMLKKS
jgi:hypothetical protein